MALLTTGVLPKIADFCIPRFPLIIGWLRFTSVQDFKTSKHQRRSTRWLAQAE